MQAFPVIKFFHDSLYTNSKKGTMETIHEVITRLKFIGTIEKGEKVSVRNMTIHQSNMFTSLLRMFYKESRETTLDFLTSTINRAFEIIQLCLSSNKQSDKTMAKNICNDLIKSSVGLINIQNTYEDDRLFLCHIQTLIQSIEVKLNDLKESYPELFIETFSEKKTESVKNNI